MDNAIVTSYVNFEVSCETNWGESLYLTGDSSSLGNFLLSNAIELITDPESYPMWKTSSPILISHTLPLMYRYAIFSEGKFKEWDPAGIRMRNAGGQDGSVLQDVYGDTSRLELNLKTASPNRKHKSRTRMLSNSHDQIIAKRDADLSTEIKKAKQEFEIGVKSSTLMIVHFRLPIMLNKNEKGEWEFSWDRDSIIAATDGSISTNMYTIWVGTVNYTAKNYGPGFADPCDPLEREAVTKLLKENRCHPIWFEPSIVDDFYRGYVKCVLYPLFHNVLEVYDDAFNVDLKNPYVRRGYDDTKMNRWYEAYHTVNKSFSNELLKHSVEVFASEKKDTPPTLWIHGYHLMLVSRMLQELFIQRLLNIHAGREPNYVKEVPFVANVMLESEDSTANLRSLIDKIKSNDLMEQYNKIRPHVVSFLHQPFPTFEVFRTLRARTHLLEGLLSSDMIGFHTFDHARHFLTACRRSVGVVACSRKGGNLGVKYMERNVIVTVSHCGVEPTYLDKAVETKACKDLRDQLSLKYKGKKMIVGIDLCDRMRGVALKMLAWEYLLTESPQYRNQAVLVQRCLYDTAYNVREGDSAKSYNELNVLVERINKMCGTIVVDFEIVNEREFAREQRCGLFENADVYMYTPVRDGLNLQPLEFTYVSQKGVAIVSEFSSSCCVLNGALRVQPFNIKEVANTIDIALNMSLEEKLERRQRDKTYISNTSAQWTRQVLADMYKSLRLASSNDVDLDEETPVSPIHKFLAPFQKKISAPLLQDIYKSAASRLFILDYGGTIVHREPLAMLLKQDSALGTRYKKPKEDMIRNLKELASDPKNIVFVITGSTQNTVSQCMDDLKNVGLISDFGVCRTWPAKEGSPRVWKVSDRLKNVEYDSQMKEWQPIAQNIIEQITWRTNGTSFSVNPHSGMIEWNFRYADPEWGTSQAYLLISKLETALIQHNVSVTMGKGVVEVMALGVNKGVGVLDVLGDFSKTYSKNPDMVVCIGDDLPDESMFNALYEWRTRSASVNKTELFTVTVGHKPSASQYWVNNVYEVGHLISELAKNK